MTKTVADVMKLVKEKECTFVDFRFVDTKGKEQHTTVPISAFDEDKFESGHAFDGSSIAGWKGIESTLTPLMERIEANFPGVKVFSLPSVGDAAKGGVYAQRHIELGIKGNANLLESAWIALRAGTQELGYEIVDIS